MNKKINYMLVAGIVIMLIILGVASSRQKEIVIDTGTVTNDEYGISIEGSLGDIAGLDVVSYEQDSQEVEDISNTLGQQVTITDIEVYDINTLDASGNVLEPSDKLKLTIQVSEDMKQAEGDTYTLYAQNEDGTYSALSGYQDENEVSTNVKHMGRYVLVKSSAGDSADAANADLPKIEELDETQYAVAVVNVRSGPDTTYEIVGSLTVGEEYHVTGRTEDGSWYQISYNDITAYVIATSLAEEAPEVSANNQQSPNTQTTNTQTPTSTVQTPTPAPTTTPTVSQQSTVITPTDNSQGTTDNSGISPGQVEGE